MVTIAPLLLPHMEDRTDAPHRARRPSIPIPCASSSGRESIKRYSVIRRMSMRPKRLNAVLTRRLISRAAHVRDQRNHLGPLCGVPLHKRSMLQCVLCRASTPRHSPLTQGRSRSPPESLAGGADDCGPATKSKIHRCLLCGRPPIHPVQRPIPERCPAMDRCGRELTLRSPYRAIPGAESFFDARQRLVFADFGLACRSRSRERSRRCSATARPHTRVDSDVGSTVKYLR
jgi:hypothetical protein